jgi:hypothetical protein
MSEDHEEVTLSWRGENYTLQRKTARGRVSRISLTIMNLLAALPLIQRACSQRLETWAGPTLRVAGASPIVPMTAKGFDVTVDAFHKDEVFLTLRDNYENDFAFALSPTDALTIAKRLAEKVRELDQRARPAQTRQ